MADYAHQSDMSTMHGWNVYLIEEEGGAFSKIGSAFNVKYRAQGLKGGNPRPLRLVQSWHFTSREIARAIEKTVLSSAEEAGLRVKGRDWIRGSADQVEGFVIHAISIYGGLK